MRRSAFVAGAGALAASPPAARGAGTALAIAVLGDSLARGTGASRADGGFIFPAYRVVRRAHPDATIDSFAIGGSTVADVERLQVPRLAELHASIVVVCVGGNDVLRRTPERAFATSYRAVVDGIRRLAPRARVILCGVPDVARSPIFARDARSIAALSAADDRAVRAIAAAGGAAFVDLFAVTRAHRTAARELAADRFHPSDAGYALLERAFAPALERAAR